MGEVVCCWLKPSNTLCSMLRLHVRVPPWYLAPFCAVAGHVPSGFVLLLPSCIEGSQGWPFLVSLGPSEVRARNHTLNTQTIFSQEIHRTPCFGRPFLKLSGAWFLKNLFATRYSESQTPCLMCNLDSCRWSSGHSLFSLAMYASRQPAALLSTKHSAGT